MMSDKERLDWIESELLKNGVFEARRYGLHWISGFSISSQHTRQYPDLRIMIDNMIETSGATGGNSARTLEEFINEDAKKVAEKRFEISGKGMLRGRGNKP